MLSLLFCIFLLTIFVTLSRYEDNIFFNVPSFQSRLSCKCIYSIQSCNFILKPKLHTKTSSILVIALVKQKIPNRKEQIIMPIFVIDPTSYFHDVDNRNKTHYPLMKSNYNREIYGKHKRRGARFNRGGGLQRGESLSWNYTNLYFLSNIFAIHRNYDILSNVFLNVLEAIYEIKYISEIKKCIKKIIKLNILFAKDDDDDTDDKMSSYQSQKQKNSNNGHLTNGSIGSKHVIRRSGATSGISKEIYLTAPRQEQSNDEIFQLLTKHKCNSCNKKKWKN